VVADRDATVEQLVIFESLAEDEADRAGNAKHEQPRRVSGIGTTCCVHRFRDEQRACQKQQSVDQADCLVELLLHLGEPGGIEASIVEKARKQGCEERHLSEQQDPHARFSRYAGACSLSTVCCTADTDPACQPA
jgi:hypothetical protein